MEDRFAGLARGDFDEAVMEKVGKIKGLFNEQAKIFDGKVLDINVQSVKNVRIKLLSEKTANGHSFGMCRFERSESLRELSCTTRFCRDWSFRSI